MSISFDRAAEFYDRTRALPPDMAEKPAEVMLRETKLEHGARVCELGIGTGRIGLTVARRIGRVTGIDLSRAMLDVLRRKLSSESLLIDLAQADLLHLPFPDEALDLAFAVSVLHLVKGWQEGIAEARRVLKTGGHFVVGRYHSYARPPGQLVEEELERLVAPLGLTTKRPGAQSEEEILAELRRWGSEPRIVDAFEWAESETPAEALDHIHGQFGSSTWAIPPKLMNELMPRLTDWARDHFGSLDQSITTTGSFRWIVAKKM